jgi:superfamily I DNA and RNA helicase
MATFYPSLPRQTMPPSERRFWDACKTLGEGWSVFHSVAWQAPRGGRQGDGESDFILLHPSHGILVVEIQGGRIEIESGEWFSTDRFAVRHGIKDPYRQAVDSKYTLLRYLRDVLRSSALPRVSHAVVFPDIRLEAPIGLQPREIAFDTVDLERMGGSLQRTLQHWGQWNNERISVANIDAIIRAFAPTLKVSRSLRSEIDEAEETLLELTARQVDALALLRSVRRAVIRGGAGTGKTLLAMEKARRVVVDGGKPLLVCFNSPLATSLTRQAAKSHVVSTFHGLCGRLGGAKVPRGADDTWFFANAATVLTDAAELLAVDEKFDAIVIDEAQDFTDDWLAALQLLLRDPTDGPVVLFLDNHQHLYGSGPSLPKAWPVIELDLNCRNTLPIAKIVAGCYGDAAPSTGAEGPAPQFIEISNTSYVDAVQHLVADLLMDKGMKASDVVVLANAKKNVEGLRTRLAGPEPFVELDGRGVAVETIHRFKGLEAKVVVLCLSGRPGEFNGIEVDRALAYVGTSRARSALFVVASRSWLQWLRPLATN